MSSAQALISATPTYVRSSLFSADHLHETCLLLVGIVLPSPSADAFLYRAGRNNFIQDGLLAFAFAQDAT